MNEGRQKSERTEVNVKGIVGRAEADILLQRSGVFERQTKPA